MDEPITKGPQPGGRQSILSVTIPDKQALYDAYMAFVKNGGLFNATKKEYALGNEVFELITLMDEKEKIPFSGRVVWVSPKGAQGNRLSGSGVQFNDEQGCIDLRMIIDGFLGGLLKSD